MMQVRAPGSEEHPSEGFNPQSSTYELDTCVQLKFGEARATASS